MMRPNAIILSIHPCHVEKILSGEKQYEYRKKIPKHVKYIFIYTTSPIKKICALVEVDEIITNSVNSIWDLTRSGSGISHLFYTRYFEGKSEANAIKIGKVHQFKQPITLNDLNNSNHAPQSYVYIKDSMESIFEKLKPNLNISSINEAHNLRNPLKK